MGLDITGPFYTAPSNRRFIVVLMDYYSRFPEVLLTDNVTSGQIITWLAEIFARYGNPCQLVSDNGPQFVSAEFSSFLAARSIIHLHSAVYNPQENGLVECFNRHIKHGVQAFTADHQSWEDGIRELLFHFRATPPADAAKCPAELFLGRPMRMDFQVPINESPSAATQPATAQPINAPCAPPSMFTRGPYRIGDQVLVRRPIVLIGQSPWSSPLSVIKVLGQWTYKLSDNQIWNAMCTTMCTTTIQPCAPPPSKR